MPAAMHPASLFDTFAERDETLRSYAESPFQYLNRTGRSYATH